METDPATADLVLRTRDTLVTDFTRWTAAVEVLAEAVLSDITDSVAPRRASLTATSETARQVLAGDPGLFGAGFVNSQDLFADGAGLIWWTRRSEEVEPRPLDIDAEFYGYTTAPWWTGCLAAEQTCVTGPYVDVSGTNEYIITISRRVDGHGMWGVVAVDICVAQIQDRLHPLLVRLPSGTCLTNQSGTVVATATGRLLGGRRDTKEPSGGIVTLAPFPWVLVLGEAARQSP